MSILQRILGKGPEPIEMLDLGSRDFVDQIAPEVYEEGKDYFQVGDVYVRGYYVADLPSSAHLQADKLLRPGGVDTWVSLFIIPLPPETVATLHRRRTELLGTEIFDARRGSLGSYRRRAQLEAVDAAIREYEVGGRPIFHLGMYLGVIADSLESLNRACQRVEDFFAAQRVVLHRATFIQPQLEYSLLPSGTDRVRQYRNMTAGALGSFFPFTRQTYYEPNGFPYGVHADNGTWVIMDPFGPNVANSSHLIIGRPGLGKSAYMKRHLEISTLLGHRAFVIDLEEEYRALVEDLGGVYITLSRSCPHSINVLEPGLGDDPFNTALSQLLGFMAIALGRELSAVERRTIIPAAYHRLLETMGISVDDPATWQKPAPTLEDLRAFMEAQGGEAAELARLLYPYTSERSFGRLFSNPTNVDFSHTPVVGFSLRGVGEDMLAPFMWVVTSLVWREVTRAGGAQPVHLYIDEGWYLLRYPDVAREIGDMGRRFRKYNAALHVATHFADDLVRSAHAQVVRGAASTVVLFGQVAEEARLVAQMFGLSDVEQARLRAFGKGDALLLWNAGQLRVPIYIPLDPRRQHLFETGTNQRMEQSMRDGVTPTVVE